MAIWESAHGNGSRATSAASGPSDSRERVPEPGGAFAGARVGALDGLRAIAVGAVVVYHLAPHLLPSGFLGVDVFMVVSGFLITGLLVREFERGGTIRLLAFWTRRFRRLVPALLFLLVVVACWVDLAGPRTLAPSLRSQGFAALLYVSNWKLIASGTTYGGVVASTSPFVHLWSLAVEEQFYLLWPLLLIGVLKLSRGRRGPVVGVAALGALGSASLMATLYRPDRDPLRLYYGTDTRAQALLVGAVAALVLPYLRPRALSILRRAGGVSLVALLLVMRTDAPGVLYRGGFLLVAIAGALAVTGAVAGGVVATWLDRVVLRAIGRVSYGIYLWHWPAIALITPERFGITGAPLLFARLGVTAAGTLASWFWVEQPLHRFRPRRVTLVSVPAVGLAALALLALPATQTLAYADVRTDRIPPPVVVVPLARTHVKVVSRRVPATRNGLALPASGTAMIVGDSGMYDETPALAAGLRQAGWRVIETAFPGEGLTRSSQLQDMWAQQVRTYHIDLTIVMLGAWDVAWEQTHGARAYSDLVQATVGRFTAAGGKVEWLSTLPGGPVDLSPMNKFYAAIAAHAPATVDYLNIDAALRAPDGSYPLRVDGRLLRKPDDWHLCPDGAEAVASAVLRHLALDRGDWASGSWRLDARYDDPHGGCPAS